MALFVHIPTHNEMRQYEGGNEDDDGDRPRGTHAVPERLDPFAAQHAHHQHGGVPEVREVPARNLAAELVWRVGGAEHLHAEHSKDVDHNGQDDRQVDECTQRPADGHQQAGHGRPRLGQFQHSELYDKTE